MEYINLHVSTLDSMEFKTSTPVQRATWLCLLRYLVGQEDGGEIKNCRDWPDRTWSQVCGITLQEVNDECLLWKWNGEDLELSFYPYAAEKKTHAQRKGGRLGNIRKAAKKKLTDTPPATVSGTVTDHVSETLTDTPPATVSGTVTEHNVTEHNVTGVPRDPDFCIPSLEEFLAASQMRGIPDWFTRQDHAWRSEQPGIRWPRTAHWQTAVTSNFERWRNLGSPTEPHKKNGANGTWPLHQKLSALRELAKSHPGNENSASFQSDSKASDRDREAFEKLQNSIRQTERELAGMT